MEIAVNHLRNATRVLGICALLGFGATGPLQADSDSAHRAGNSEKPLPWPEGIVPYDLSRLSVEQQETVRRAMQRWMDTGARVAFIPRTTQTAYVYFTGKTDAGNNASQTGFKPGTRTEINITAFWWRQGEWMPVHELGHVLGFHHEHARWDRDDYVTIHYENLKPERRGDYDWIPKADWLVSSTAYDYYSIMHYRVCWSSACEPQCKDGDGASPCAVIDPVGTNYDRVIGQWTDNGISATDVEKLRRAYGTGPSIYIDANNEGRNTGTLIAPFHDLAQAFSCRSNSSRLILAPGNYAVPTPVNLQHWMILSPAENQPSAPLDRIQDR